MTDSTDNSGAVGSAENEANSQASLAARTLFAPRYWPTWCGLAMLRVGIALPFAWQQRLGRALGRLMYVAAPGRRRIAQANIALCFPDMSPEARRRLSRQAFEAAGCAVIETGLSWWGSQARLERLCCVEGLEHLQQARRLGRGVILLGGHYTTLEVSGRCVMHHIPDLCPIYKPARNPLIESVMARARSASYDTLLSNRDMRGILRRLRQGKVIWYAPDQDFGARRSVFAPFMGVPAASLPITARLARLSGAPVLPFYSERLSDGQGYRVRILPPLQNFPSGDDVQDAITVNAVIEQQVRRTPEQYLWLHRRFKSRPPGEPPVYSRKR